MLFPDGVPVDPFTRQPFEFDEEMWDAFHIEAAVPWLNEYPDGSREGERIYWQFK